MPKYRSASKMKQDRADAGRLGRVWLSKTMLFGTSVETLHSAAAALTNGVHVNNVPLKGGCVGPFSYMLMSLLS